MTRYMIKVTIPPPLEKVKYFCDNAWMSDYERAAVIQDFALFVNHLRRNVKN